eukprot:CAMPEP_0176397912 /NCGR_PEP_ID=MMETSP0126-20121128/45507_1 /TAXON_ID=141414 ORGANISM="Strombidinopsis acuminatum, Strain SPMC142" /NCGR_SAMPLE_ID=MMETSP0126 /ASSEMBLY_ACC=CAM_ASM_000229 /LENGTH=37 /DNA_ID= /DNA_START= /DNA_END= /DNA_ORIENTATION=
MVVTLIALVMVMSPVIVLGNELNDRFKNELNGLISVD